LGNEELVRVQGHGWCLGDGTCTTAGPDEPAVAEPPGAARLQEPAAGLQEPATSEDNNFLKCLAPN